MTLKDNNNPPLNGLVLAGGKSVRMGESKAQMNWHGKAQQYYVADMLESFCASVYISCKADQKQHLDQAYQGLSDSFLNMGPSGGILSALRYQRDCAWLVVACDLPLLNQETLAFLVENRSPQRIATTYESPHDGLPEPLITIWEPGSYMTLLTSLGRGITCPRKVLINADVHILKPVDKKALMNVNTPAQASEARDILGPGKK